MPCRLGFTQGQSPIDNLSRQVRGVFAQIIKPSFQASGFPLPSQSILVSFIERHRSVDDLIDKIFPVFENG